MIVRPAQATPLTALALGELAVRAGVPAGVLQIVSGSSSVIGGVLTASSAKDYADVAFQRSAFACAHANSLTIQKQHAGHDRTGGSREKLR